MRISTDEKIKKLKRLEDLLNLEICQLETANDEDAIDIAITARDLVDQMDEVLKKILIEKRDLQ